MKKKIFLLILISIVIVVGVIFSITSFFSSGKQLILEDEKIIASTLNIETVFSAKDSENVFDVKLRELSDYFVKNKINTAIIEFDSLKKKYIDPLYDDDFQNLEYLQKKDIIENIKLELRKNKIQIMLKIDCSNMTTDDLTEYISQLNKKYSPSGVLLENYDAPYEYLKQLKQVISKNYKKYYLGLNLEDTVDADKVQQIGGPDLYLFNNITRQEYHQLKNRSFQKEIILINNNSETFLGDLFILSNFSQLDGMILTDYTCPDTDLSLYQNVINTSKDFTKFGFKVDNQFFVSNPKEDTSTYYKGLFVTGVAEPESIVLVNGQQVKTTVDGTFGLFIELNEGDNIVEVSQNGNTIKRVVTKKSYTSSGGVISKPQWDETQKAEKGQIIKTVNQLTSVLSNPDDDNEIIAGLEKDVQLVVEDNVQTKRGGKNTWAYKLSNGAYILAKNVEFVDEKEYVQPELSYLSQEKIEDENEYITINITGKPAIISYDDEEKLELRILNSTLSTQYMAQPTQPYTQNIESRFFTAYTLQQEGENILVTLQKNPENELWGYHIEYPESDLIKVYLKKSPHKTEGDKPLAGVRIMLDAGHGGKDTGAPPVGGIIAPYEKDLNLAVSIATKEILEEFGATVYMTRTDDSFPTLMDRRNMINEVKPDLYISQHHNSLEYTVDGSKYSGSEVYYFSPQSKYMAEIMAERISQATNRRNRGHKYAYFYVLRNNIAPSVLNEYGFMLNPFEYSNLHNDIDIYNAAFGTVNAIIDIIPE